MQLENDLREEEDDTLDIEPERKPRLWTLIGLAIAALVGLGVYGPYYWAYSPEQVCSEQTQVPYEVCLGNVSFAQSAGW